MNRRTCNELQLSKVSGNFKVKARQKFIDTDLKRNMWKRNSSVL